MWRYFAAQQGQTAYDQVQNIAPEIDNDRE